MRVGDILRLGSGLRSWWRMLGSFMGLKEGPKELRSSTPVSDSFRLVAYR